jgi:DNA polymerase/3'-5' exonuclease PolX
MEKKNKIISELETMRQMDYAEGRKFQAVAYQKAIQQLKAFPGEVNSVEDVAGLPGFGAKIKTKIQEILTTGGLAAAAKAREDPNFGIYEALLKIYGVGPAKAKGLMAEGIKTLEDLKKREDLLTTAQKIGLKYYDDFTLRIPREEMQKHEKMILGSLDVAFKGQVVGSYRRGAADSGDIDVLLTLPDTMPEADRV